MPRIDDLLTAGTTYSFEFFPPRTDAGEAKLRATLNELEPLGPSFVSVTYGAGGSTRERTHQIVVDMLERTTMTPMAHLTAVNHSRAELAEILARYRDAGVQNVLALRGDPPGSPPGPTSSGDEGEAVWELERAMDLVELAHEVGGGQFAVGVAAHPEGHPASPDLGTDRRHLAAKLKAADFGVTQFFFDVDDYLAMVEEVGGHGCETPIVPGVMPVTNVRQIERFAQLSGAGFPAELAERLQAVADDPVEVAHIGVEVATELCQRLLDAGAPGLHFYTLNASTATREIYANLNLPVPQR